MKHALEIMLNFVCGVCIKEFICYTCTSCWHHED